MYVLTHYVVWLIFKHFICLYIKDFSIKMFDYKDNFIDNLISVLCWTV
jgi:hypothetical protein